MKNETLEACARAAHEANRAYCIAIGDTSQPSWEDAPDWQKSSARNGIELAVNGGTPRQSHESWMMEKLAAGWRWAPTKNPEAKEHHCLVPYDELPAAQRAKDAVYIAVVNAMHVALETPL